MNMKFKSLTSFIIILFFLLNISLKAAPETNHLLISEIAYDGSSGIIELYNPTGSAINLSNAFRLERDSNGGGSDPSIWGRIEPADGYIRTSYIIPAHGYYLIVDNGATSYTNIADFVQTRGSTSLNDDDVIYLGTDAISGPADPDIVDFVGFGNPAGTYEGSGPAPNPSAGGSIERKAWSGASSASMTNGADTNHGNAFDSNDNGNDFVSQGSRNFQNTSSPIEDPYFPPIEEITLSQKTNYSTAIVSQGANNVSLLAISVSDNSNNRTLHSIKVTNQGRLPDTQITTVRVWYDVNSDNIYSGGDSLVCTLGYDGSSKFFTNYNISSSVLVDSPGSTFIITGDISASADDGKNIKMQIPVDGLAVGVSGTITVSNTSAVGNSDNLYTTPTYNVVYNELSWAGTPKSTADEWCELYNNTISDISLNGWQIVALDGSPSVTLGAGTITNKQFVLIERTDDNAVPGVTADYTESIGFGNSGEQLLLLDNNGDLSDFLDFPSSWPAGSSGPNYYSMARYAPYNPGTNGNWYSSPAVYTNMNGTNYYGTPRAVNTNYIAPPDILTFINYDAVASNIHRGDKNVTVYAFKGTDSYNHKYKISQFVNNLTLSNNEITNISIYKDSNIDRYFTAGEPLIERLAWTNAGFWKSTNTIPLLMSESNYIMTISLSTNITFGHAIQGRVQVASCSNGATASGSLNANVQTVVSYIPNITAFTATPTTVTNQYKNTFLLNAYVAAQGDGVGNVTVVFSNYEGSYTNYSLTNAGGNNYRLDYARIPGNVDPTNYTLILRAYDGYNYAYDSNTTKFTVEGNWNPTISSFVIDPTNGAAGDTIVFTVTASDQDGTIASVLLDLSSLGGSSAQSMKSVNATKWTFSYELPQDVVLGNKTVQVNITDNNGGTASTSKSFTVTEIKEDFALDLKNAHPYNTVIKPTIKEMRFMNLSEGTKATIYTISGNKVAEVPTENKATLTWMIPDNIAAGVYIVYLEDEAGNTKKLKIIIVR